MALTTSDCVPLQTLPGWDALAAQCLMEHTGNAVHDTDYNTPGDQFDPSVPLVSHVNCDGQTLTTAGELPSRVFHRGLSVAMMHQHGDGDTLLFIGASSRRAQRCARAVRPALDGWCVPRNSKAAHQLRQNTSVAILSLSSG